MYDNVKNELVSKPEDVQGIAVVMNPDPELAQGLMPDNQIRHFALNHNMIEPFTDGLVRESDLGEGIISYGLSSYGYDIRLGNKFKVFTNVNTTVVDPKAIDKTAFIDIETDVIIIPPNSFILAYSLEKIKMPANAAAIVLSKSTYARAGVICLATPLEPEWEGHVTLEFANTTNLPVKMYAGEGCCQILFLASNPCDTTYADRGGKYMHQAAEPVLGKA